MLRDVSIVNNPGTPRVLLCVLFNRNENRIQGYLEQATNSLLAGAPDRVDIIGVGWSQGAKGVQDKEAVEHASDLMTGLTKLQDQIGNRLAAYKKSNTPIIGRPFIFVFPGAIPPNAFYVKSLVSLIEKLKNTGFLGIITQPDVGTPGSITPEQAAAISEYLSVSGGRKRDIVIKPTSYREVLKWIASAIIVMLNNPKDSDHHLPAPNWFAKK